MYYLERFLKNIIKYPEIFEIILRFNNKITRPYCVIPSNLIKICL